MLGGGAAAASDDIEASGLQFGTQRLGESLRCLEVVPRFIGMSGVGMAADGKGRDLCEPPEMGYDSAWSEGAVET